MSYGQQSDSRKRSHSNQEDEDFARDVRSRTRRWAESKFGQENLFEALSLDEPGDTRPLSKSEIFETIMASEDAPRPTTAMDIDMEQSGKPSWDSMKRPHPECDDYLSKPGPLSVHCMLKMSPDGIEYGHFVASKNKSPLAILFRINHGHLALPEVSLTVRRSKNVKNAVKHDQPGSFMEAFFTWAPGVTTEKNEDGTPVYQLHACQAGTLDQYEASHSPIGRNGQPIRSMLNGLPAETVNRLVVVRFQGHTAEIESEKSARGLFKIGATADVVQLVDLLFANRQFQCAVAFLVPDTLGMNAQQWISENFTKTIARDVERRTIPWAPYFQDGELAINLDMPSIRTFANRMLANFNKTQRQQVLAACSEDDSSDRFPEGFVLPEPTSFVEYEAVRTYPMMKLFGVPHATTVVREYQWQDGEYRVLSLHDIQFQVVRTLRPKSKPVKDTELNPRPERSEAQVKQESSFYLCGYLPPGCPVPPENSQWLINWTVAGFHDDVIPEEDKKKWVAFVRPMSYAERKESHADFLLVAQKPPGAVFVPAVDGFDKVSTKIRQLARMEPVINRLPSERVIDSIKEFVSDGRNDVDNVRIPLIFGPEKYKQPTVDLAEGVDDEETAKEVIRSIYQQALDILGTFFNEAQMSILKKALREIENGICLIFGGPGCKKTTTMAYAVLVLNLCGHKVLVVAEENLCLDNFVDYLVEARQEMLELVRGNEEYLDLALGLEALKFLRHIPPAIEERSLRETFDATKAGKHYHAGQAFDPRAFQKDSKAEELVRAYASYQERLQTCQEMEQNRKLESLNSEALSAETKMEMDRIQADLRRLQADYQRTHKLERNFTYPTTASLAWHVSQIEAARDDLDQPVRDVLNNFLEARQACKDEEPGVTKTIHRYNTINLSESTKTLIGSVLEQMDVVACTYVNCATPLMRAHFKPTVVVHEEASRARLGTQTAALVYRHVKAHCFVGDPEQMPPMATADHLNEHRQTAAVAGITVLMDQGNRVHWINEQYRMHPSMISFPNRQWYQNVLKNASHTAEDNANRKAWREIIYETYKVDLSRKEDGLGSQYVAIDVPKGVGLAKKPSRSLENHASADALVSMVVRCLDKGIPAKDIVLGVYYKDQRELVRNWLVKRHVVGVDVVTVDSYQGHDSSIWMVDLTATAHSKEQLARWMDPAEEPVFQSISAHVKSRHRLNVALTRGKDGIAVFGNFRSISKAVRKVDTSQKSTGKDLSDFITDAVSRELMLLDPTEDTNPAIVNRQISMESRDDRARYEHQMANTAWMYEHREHNARARRNDVAASSTKKTTTYAGPDQGGPLGPFPAGEALVKVKGRSQRALLAKKASEAPADGPDAKKPKQKQNNSSKRKGKKAKRDAASQEVAAEFNKPGPIPEAEEEEVLND